MEQRRGKEVWSRGEDAIEFEMVSIWWKSLDQRVDASSRMNFLQQRVRSTPTSACEAVYGLVC